MRLGRRGERERLLRQPLNAIFAAEANVRVLRVLVEHGDVLTAPEVAGRARVTVQHARVVLADLAAVGVGEEVGAGRYRSYRARPAYPLYPALRALFEAERERFEGVLAGIREAAQALEPRPRGVWLYGSVARGEDRVGSDVDVAVAFDVAEVGEPVARLRAELLGVEDRFGVRISVVGLGSEDVLRVGAEDAWWGKLVADAWTLAGLEPGTLLAQLQGKTTSARKVAERRTDRK
jgi:predicted nucleotidyltransferase